MWIIHPFNVQRLLGSIAGFFFLLSNSDALAQPPLTLSLNEAILLAVRDNPDVKKSEFAEVRAKYQVEIEQWKFSPQFAFKATETTSRQYSVESNGQVSQIGTAIQPGVSIKSPIGTDATLTSTNDFSQNHFYPGVTLQVTQPLMRGFGRAIVEQALYNAKDDETSSHLRRESQLRRTITSVIHSYLAVASAEDTLRVDQEALARATQSIMQTKLLIKAGQKAGTELTTQEAGVATNQTTIESAKNDLEEKRYALLQSIGIDPNTPLTVIAINPLALTKKYKVQPLDDAKKIMIEHDVDYRIAEMTLQGVTQRALLAAEDNQRWQLNLTGSVHAGGVGSSETGINSVLNGVNQTSQAGLELTIPIDDREAKIAVQQQKIAIREATMDLKQSKWQNETKVINGWNAIYSRERKLRLSEHAETLQKKSYAVSLKKYAYGLINSIELQREQEQLMLRQQELVGDQVNYLQALVDFDELLGSTLKTWNVAMKDVKDDFKK